MKQHLTASKFVLALGLFACALCITSFRGGAPQQKTFRDDTFRQAGDTTKPGKRNRGNNEIRVEELDKATRQLDEQMVRLDEQLKKMDLRKVEKQVNEALSKTKMPDAEKIAKEVEASIAKVDWQKIEADMQEAKKHLNDVEWKKVNEEMKAAMKKMKEVDMEKIKEEVSKAHAEVVKIDHKKIKEDVEKAMAGAKVSIEKAKVDMQNLRDFTKALESDGLIKKNQPYKIEVKGNELYINDVKQSKEVSEKYRKYYKKSDFSISNNQNGVSI